MCKIFPKTVYCRRNVSCRIHYNYLILNCSSFTAQFLLKPRVFFESFELLTTADITHISNSYDLLISQLVYITIEEATKSDG